MSDRINVIVNGKEMTAPKGITFMELAKLAGDDERRFVIAKSGNELYELLYTVQDSMDVEFYDVTNIEGMRVYTRSVSMLMIKAAKDVLGDDTPIIIEHSINNNYYCEINKPGFRATQDALDVIKNRMREIVDEDIPIEKFVMSRDEAIETAMNNNMHDKARLFRYRRASNVNLYGIDGFLDYSF